MTAKRLPGKIEVPLVHELLPLLLALLLPSLVLLLRRTPQPVMVVL